MKPKSASLYIHISFLCLLALLFTWTYAVFEDDTMVVPVMFLFFSSSVYFVVCLKLHNDRYNKLTPLQKWQKHKPMPRKWRLVLITILFLPFLALNIYGVMIEWLFVFALPLTSLLWILPYLITEDIKLTTTKLKLDAVYVVANEKGLVIYEEMEMPLTTEEISLLKANYRNYKNSDIKDLSLKKKLVVKGIVTEIFAYEDLNYWEINYTKKLQVSYELLNKLRLGDQVEISVLIPGHAIISYKTTGSLFQYNLEKYLS